MFRIYLLENVLCESRIDGVKANNPTIPSSVIDHYVNHALPANDKSALEWVVKQHKLGNITPETSHSLLPHIEAYNRHKASLGKLKDYDVEGLKQATEPLLLSNQTKNQMIDKDTETVYDSPTMRVQRHLTYDSARKGRTLHPMNHTRSDRLGNWCVGIDPKHFHAYTEDGNFYTVENKKGQHEKTGIVTNDDLSDDEVYRESANGYQVRDEDDETIHPNDIEERHKEISKVPELHKFFKQFSGYKINHANSPKELSDSIRDVSIENISDYGKSITSNKHYNDEHFNAIYDRAMKHPHDGISALSSLVVSDKTTPNQLKKVIYFSNASRQNEIRNKVLMHDNATRDVLKYAIENNPNDLNNEGVVHSYNGNGDEDLYKMMLKSDDEQGAMAAAYDTREHHDIAKDHWSDEVRAKLFANPSYKNPDDDINAMLDMPKTDERKMYLAGVTSNPNTSQEMLKKIATDKTSISNGEDARALYKIKDEDFVNNQFDNASTGGREAIVKRPTTSPELLAKALHHNNSSGVVMFALQHNNTRKEDIMKLNPDDYHTIHTRTNITLAQNKLKSL